MIISINIPEGATNGEVLCMLFPNMHYTLSDKSPRVVRVVTTIGVASSFNIDWWNSSYKANPDEIDTLEQEPCEVDYIKVPKKALKYRTAGMVAYNVEWLKNHFELERAVICGQQFCEYAISRRAVQ